MKKTRGRKRKDKGVGFYAEYETLRYAMYWNTRYEAERQPFYRPSKRSRKVADIVGKKAYKLTLRNRTNR